MNDLQPGTRVGGYEIDSLLGRGGMGVVYRARHLRLGRMVALKVLAPELAADENFRTRFVRESQMAASIDHPNVIPVYDADEIDGVLFLSMRYVEGTDLKKVIESDGALEPDQVVSVLTQIGGALDAAHARGLIHRDVKPANVLVGRTDTGSQQIYLTDFGLTKHSSSKSGLTATGAFVGTIDYIAPEQIEGKSVDARTDIYALGCVLFECLTGQVPFVKDADVAVMYAHLMDPRPTVTEANPALPVAVDAVLHKAMARDPDDRYPSAGALVADLRSAFGFAATPDGASFTGTAPAGVSGTTEVPPSAAAPPTPAPSGARRLSGKVMAGAAAAVIAIAALAFFLTRDGGESGEESSRSTTSGGSGGVFVSPDGSEGAAGTQDDPVGSLEEAAAMAGAGGTVTLMDGVYEATATPMLKLGRGITLTAAEGATPVLRGTDEHPDGIYFEAGTTGVTISGLTFENFLGEELKFFCFRCEEVPENRDIVLENLEFLGGGSPIIIENVEGLSLQGITVEENEHTGLLCSPGPCNNVSIVDSFFHSARQPGATGITIESGDQVLIETTDVSFNAGDGIRSNASGTQVIRSRATNNGDVGMSLTGSDSEVRDSIIAVNRNVGLLMGEAGCQGCSSTGVFKAVNVLVVQNGIGVSVENDDEDEIDFQMFNTIVTNNGSAAVQLTGATKLVRFDHNLVFGAGNVAVAYRGQEYDEDDLGNGRLPGDIDDETYGYAPDFQGPGDFQLAEGSEGIDEGTQDGVISQVDIDGNPRLSGSEIDIGPYER